MGGSDVLTVLLSRHRSITCAALEFSIELNVSILCAEVRKKEVASQQRVVRS